MPKLLIMASEFPPGPGGIGTHAYQISLALANLGWQVTILSAQEHASPTQIAEFNIDLPIPLYPIYQSGIRKAIAYLHHMRHLLKYWEPDLILASGVRPLWYASTQSHVPYLAVLHGRELRYGSAIQRSITRRALVNAAYVIPVSEYTHHQMISIGIRPSRTQVIPNGGDSTAFTPLDCNSQQPTLLTVGSVSTRKGQDVVIRALPRILESFPNTSYQIAGAPFEADRLITLAHHVGVWDHIELLGIVSSTNLLDLYRCCDVFVMTSRHTQDDFEGYGIAVIEAALCGKPAIVSSDSGLQEAVVDGETGFVIPQDDPEAAAQAAIMLLGDQVLRRQMGYAAYQRAISEQSWQVRALEYHTLLCSLINV